MTPTPTPSQRYDGETYDHPALPKPRQQKHIVCKKYWVKEKLDNNSIDVQHQGTKGMLADMNTKPQATVTFLNMRDAVTVNVRAVHEELLQN